jgi:hypothetical protein
MEPFISKSIHAVNEDFSDLKIVARNQIAPQTVVEICPTYSISGRAAIALGSSNKVLERRIIADTVRIDKEYRIFAELGELELEKRLNSGQLSQEDYNDILRSKVNLNALLDAKTHLIPLGYGLLYGYSEYPNLVREFDVSTKLCIFRTVKYVQEGDELTYYS